MNTATFEVKFFGREGQKSNQCMQQGLFGDDLISVMEFQSLSW